jgi:hypothetical protein
MAWVQQQAFNLGEISPGASIKSGEPNTAAGLKELRNGFVRYDNTVEKRHGSVSSAVANLPSPVSDLAPRRVIPFSYGGKDYAIVLVALDSANLARMYVKSRDDGWTTPLNSFSTSYLWLNGNSSNHQLSVSGGYYTESVNGPDAMPSPYREADLDDVQAVSYEDAIYLLHPSYPPIRLKPGRNDDIYYPPSVTDEPWSWSDRPFGAGPELGGRRSPVLFTASSRSSASFAKVTASSPIFTDPNLEPVMPVPTTGPGVPTRVGAIYRIGGNHGPPGNDQARHGKYGQFWYVERKLSSSAVHVQRIVQTGLTSDLQINPDELAITGTSSEESEPNEWAGPWIDTLQHAVATLSWPQLRSGESTEITLADFGVQAAEPDITGCLLVLFNNNALITFAYYISGYNDIAQSYTIANVGPDTTTSLPTMTWGATGLGPRIMRPSADASVVAFSGEGGIPGNAQRMRIWGTKGLPENHETRFELLSGRQYGGDEYFVGGAVFANGGVFRLVSKVEPDPTDSSFTSKQYLGYWEKSPTCAGPSSSWGHGWSFGTGFPGVATIHQQRLVMAGFKDPPSSVVASSPARPDQTRVGDWAGQPDSPLNLKLTGVASDESVRWLASQNRHLQIGTTHGEYSLRGVPLSPQSIGLEPHSKYGSTAAYQGVASIGPFSAFLAEGGSTLREMQVESDTGQFVSPNVLSLAEHILDPGDKYVQIVAIQNRSPFYALRSKSGRLVFFSRHIESQIAAPSPVELFKHRAETDLGLATTPASKKCVQIWSMKSQTAEDEVLWALWQYTPQGAVGSYTAFVAESYEDGVYVDGRTAATVEGGALGLPRRLSGRTLSVFENGNYLGDYDSTDGVAGQAVRITMEFAANSNSSYTVGEPYIFKASPTVKDSVFRDGATTAGEIRQINNVRLYLVESSAGNIVEDNSSQVLPPNSSSFSGWVEVPGVGVNGRDPVLSVQSRFPFPFRVSSICMEVGMR